MSQFFHINRIFIKNNSTIECHVSYEVPPIAHMFFSSLSNSLYHSFPVYVTGITATFYRSQFIKKIAHNNKTVKSMIRNQLTVISQSDTSQLNKASKRKAKNSNPSPNQLPIQMTSSNLVFPSNKTFLHLKYFYQISRVSYKQENKHTYNITHTYNVTKFLD